MAFDKSNRTVIIEAETISEAVKKAVIECCTNEEDKQQEIKFNEKFINSLLVCRIV